LSQRLPLRENVLVSTLRPLIDLVIKAVGTEELFESSVELLCDILANHPGFLTESHYDNLFSAFDSSWSEAYYQRLIQGETEFECLQYGHLMVALGDARVSILIQKLDPRTQRFLNNLSSLLSASGYPVGDNKIFVPALEFWSTFVESIIDSIPPENDQERSEWVNISLHHVMQAISHAWRKIAFPPVEVYGEWDSTERSGFVDARKDFADLLQSAYAALGPQLLTIFVDLMLKSISSASWSDLDAAGFCLGSLADCVIGDERCEESLRVIFSNSLFGLLHSNRNEMTPRARQTCIYLIEQFADYFEQHSDGLSAALNILFSNVSDNLLSSPAAKSIHKLCYSCRSLLTSDINTFLGSYESLSSQHLVDCFACEKVIGGIAAVIQSVNPEIKKLQAAWQLLQYVRKDIDFMLKLLSTTNRAELIISQQLHKHRCIPAVPTVDMPLHLGLKALRCLLSIGKGFQTPNDSIIDLETDGYRLQSPTGTILAQLQAEIIEMAMRVQQEFPESGEVVEIICNVFRTGFSETQRGPFVFPPEVISRYLVNQRYKTPRIGAVVSMACSFISSFRKATSDRFDEISGRILDWNVGLLRELPSMSELTIYQICEN
jgi:hypothetical protein